MITLSLFIVVFLAPTILLLNAVAKVQNQTLEGGGRELREVDDAVLSKLQNEFEQLRHELAENETLHRGLDITAAVKDSVIERLERKLGLKLPFWDYTIDTTLTSPLDSSILLMDLCRGSREGTNGSFIEVVRGVEGENGQQMLEIKQNCKNGALLALLQLGHGVSQGNCSRCEAQNSRRWLFCDTSTRQCISKIILNGNCTKFTHNPECCYQSTCQRGICSTEVKGTSTRDFAVDGSHREKFEKVTAVAILRSSWKNSEKPPEDFISDLELSTRLPENVVPSRDFPSVRINRTLVNSHDSLPEEFSHSPERIGSGHISKDVLTIGNTKNESFDNYRTNISSNESRYDAEQPKIYKEEQPGPILGQNEVTVNQSKFDEKHPALKSSDFKKKEKVGTDELVRELVVPSAIQFLQRYSATFRKRKLPTRKSQKSRKLKELKNVNKLKSNAHLYGHDTPTMGRSPIMPPKIRLDVPGKLKKGVKSVTVSKKKQRKATEVNFDRLTVPSQYVYFSITVIRGEPKRNSLLNQAVQGCEITVIGANMPYGFTEQIKGQLSPETTMGIARTLNPEMFGPLIEFNMTVSDRHGHRCQQRCLSSKGNYDLCEDRPIRLSSHEFIAFSDPIDVYETQKLLAKRQWTGRGYYRRRKQDFLLFACGG